MHLVERLRGRGYVLMDIQQLTPHTAQFGAIEIPRAEYLRRLADGARGSGHLWQPRRQESLAP